MPREFLIANNPAPNSRFPLLLLLPLLPRPVVLATRADWPVDKDLYCHELEAWPDGVEVVDCVPVITCHRNGASIELVLDRPQRRRSLFVFTASRQGKRLVFWRSERSMRASRPGVRTPQARGLDGPMEVVVDTRERYPWRFANNPVTVERRRLPVGDYGVFDGSELAAVVERKKLNEFVGSAVNGQLALAMAELATMPRAAVIIEGRLSKLLATDETRVRPGWILNLTAALQAAYPNVPLLFAETGPLAGDLAYRWLSACMNLRRSARRGTSISEALGAVIGVNDSGTVASPPPEPTATPLFGLEGLTLDHSVDRAAAPLDRAGRQRLALQHLTARGSISVADHARLSGVSTPTASKDLHELVADGTLIAKGRARSLTFELPTSPDRAL